MRIVFFGTSGFAVPSLEALLGSSHDVIAVVTKPDRTSGRGRKLIPSPVKTVSRRAGIQTLQPDSVREEDFPGILKKLSPSVMVVVSYGQILPVEVLSVPDHGCINVHASLLPRYRGAAPIHWALIRGEIRTGITTILMDEGLDTGPVLLKKEVEIRDEDTAGTLAASLAREGAATLMHTMEMMVAGLFDPVPQSGEASYAPPLRKTDGLIHWSRPATEIHNLIRGTNPWPGAYTFLQGERTKILRALPQDGEGDDGVIVRASKSDLVVGTGKGLLALLEVQRPGKSASSIHAYLQGRRLSEGMRFEEEPVN